MIRILPLERGQRRTAGVLHHADPHKAILVFTPAVIIPLIGKDIFEDLAHHLVIDVVLPPIGLQTIGRRFAKKSPGTHHGRG
jgi:hypothetical protein